MTASPTPGPRRLARSTVKRRTLAAAAAAIALALTACTSATSPSTVTTAAVQAATITTGVSATGTLASDTSQNLGFPAGGQLTSVAVKVGDHVKAGQVLATVDDFLLRQLVTQQEANLASQKAALAKLSNSPAPAGVRNAAGQAQTILDATKGQVSATGQADQVAITRANAGLDGATQAQTAAQAAVAACTANCATLQSALASAKGAVTTATTAVATAQQKQQVDAAAGQVSIGAAQQGVVTAQNAANSAVSDRPYTITQQQSAVTLAQSLVDIARHNLAQATLKAPFDGTVTAINGRVGEFLTASTGTTAEAPGSMAAVPGTTVNTAASTIARAGGTQFMVIAGSGPLTAVLSFPEGDAATIVTGEAASLTFDALPDVSAVGTVTSVAPTGTAINGTTNYYVTVRLSTSDGRLRDGMSAHASISAQVRKDVLSVPNNAVHAQDGKTYVTLVDAAGQQRTVTFQAGLVGPDRTEVLSGLSAGDSVVVPSTH